MAAAQQIANIEGVDTSLFTSEAERTKAKDAARALLMRLETPFETGWRLTFDEPATGAVLKTLLDLGIFSKWNKMGADKVLPVSELAALSGCDAAMLDRMCRHLGATGYLTQIDGDSYKNSRYTEALGGSLVPSLAHHHFGVSGPVFLDTPAYMKSVGYKDPTDSSKTAIIQKTGKSVFDFCANQPGLEKNFADMMALISEAITPWVDLYPTQTLVDAHEEGRAILVDIGGSTGHDIGKLLLKHPGLPKSSLVIQDRSEIISLPSVQALKDSVTPMPHDFFTEQPVSGARAYYLHHVLHDWSNDDAVRILKQIVPAMKPGYSSVLIHELSNPPMHPNSFTTSHDIIMMTFFSARERTDNVWEELIAASGLKIKKFWTRPDSNEQIIEAIVP